MQERLKGIHSFGLAPGRRLSNRYVVGDLLGRGWEGEVYHVTEIATGIERAAKLFFPERNLHNRAVRFYARKLHKLRDCPLLIPYHTQDAFQFRGCRVTFLVSEYVHGRLLPDFLARQKGRRLDPFEALHLLYPLVHGLEYIHAAGEYHGDLHSENIMLRREGLGFHVKLLDFYHWGKMTAEHVQDDLRSAIRIFYDAIGGPKRYAGQPQWVKDVCCGLKHSLIRKKFRTARHLRSFLEHLDRDP
ncbi:MAG: protein kinase [Candidatus Hydrogenedentes bacterium]|nr:protein kinase [Candidatus Hydrogenedentota bacterium]